MNFLYLTLPGRLLLKIVFVRPWFSRLVSVYKSSAHSAKGIPDFISTYQIDLAQCDKKEFHSFNEFFTRKKRVETTAMPSELISPSDSKLTVCTLTDQSSLTVKGVSYTLGELLNDRVLAEEYTGGTCLIYRLSLTDYHRYLYIDSGIHAGTRHIAGVLHTVRPVSSEFKVFAQNTRYLSILKTKHFGTVLHMEVGAMLVGKIVNHKKQGGFQRMEEKGYFEYGGSTIIQMFQKGTVTIDTDILDLSRNGIETKVEIGEKIGHAKETSYLF